MIERWEAVVGYEGIYDVSEYGRVRSLDRLCRNGRGMRKVNGKILSLPTNCGYSRITLRNRETKSLLVQRLVLEAFIGPCPIGMEALHKNGNRKDNHLTNLRWGTRSENTLDSVRHGTFVGPSKRVRCGDGREFKSGAEAARSIGRTTAAISYCCIGKTKTCAKLTWEYI